MSTRSAESEVKLIFSATIKNTLDDGQVASVTLGDTIISGKIQSGVEANQANRVWADTDRTLSSGATEDIDIYDEEDIWLALSSRVQWDRDIHVIPGGRGAGTDPSLLIDGVTAKMIIDATKPLPTERPFSSRNTVPADILKRIKLQDYIPELYEKV